MANSLVSAMATRVPVLEDEIISEVPVDKEEDKVHAVGLAGQIGNVNGGAMLLEAFYCYPDDDHNRDFGFDDSGEGLPEFPPELEFYKNRTFEVNYQ